jgi:hypothetical protein
MQLEAAGEALFKSEHRREASKVSGLVPLIKPLRAWFHKQDKAAQREVLRVQCDLVLYGAHEKAGEKVP